MDIDTKEVGAIHFRSMHESDLPAVYLLEKQSQPYPWPRWCFRSLIRMGTSCWVLENDSEIIGFGILRIAKNRAHIMNMCIAPSYRRLGLGRRIMLHMLADAKKKHARLAWLEVRSNNRTAILLYRKLGFRAAEIRKAYYKGRRGRENAIIMARKL